MLSAILLSDPPSDAAPVAITRDIAKTLAGLVPFVIGNLVADALLVTRPGSDLLAIEQRSGCTIVEDPSLQVGLTRAISTARRRTILLMRPGFVLPPAFGDEIVEALGASPPQARRVNPAPVHLGERFLPGLLPAAALVVPAGALADAAETARVSLSALARALRAKPLRTTALRV